MKFRLDFFGKFVYILFSCLFFFRLFPNLFIYMTQDLKTVRLKMQVRTFCVALNRFDRKDTLTIQPTGERFEEHIFTVSNNGDYRSLFIIDENDIPRLLYGPIGAFKIQFEAEPFLYIMENFSNKDRLVFFRHAELPSLVEANKFLALVDASNLSKKDCDRAYTWMQKMVKRLN